MDTIDKTIRLKDGRKLGYAGYGDPKGKPILVFHGWPGSRLGGSIMNELATQLHIRLIFLERPGYGLSDFKEKRTLLDWVNDVIEFADMFNLKKFGVLGISGGGPYALACAYEIPEKITKVGVVSGMPPPIEEAIKTNDAWWKFLIKYYRYPIFSKIIATIHYIEANYFPKIFLKWYKSKYDASILTEDVMENVAVSKREAFHSGLQGAVQDLVVYASDWGFNLKDIKKHVILWHGDIDTVVPVTTAEYFANNIPNSKLTIYSNEAHSIFISHAKEILASLIS